MGLSSKAKNNNEGWGGLGLFLVFFPDDGENNNKNYLEKKKLLSSSSSFSTLKSPTSTSSTTTTNYSTNQLFNKAQSTISICALLVFFTLLFFTLSNFDHNNISHSSSNGLVPRRWLNEKHFNKFKIKNKSCSSSSLTALQGMGTLFRRGTRAMSDLIVAHLTEDLKDEDFRVFLRTLHLSGITARADVVLIFSTTSTTPSNFSTMIHQENESFLKLVQNSTRVTNGFDLTQFTKESKPGGEPLWGRKIHTNSSITEQVTKNELSYGSIVGFEVSELDPVESLSGFLDHIPIRLRRWACYPMLLGRVRRNFKHIMLVNAKDVILLGDSLARIRSKGGESVHLWKNSGNSRSHGKKDTKSVTADAIMGGMRGIRLLSNAMLNEIVRAAIQHKSKSTISDSVILSQLVNNESLLKSLNIVTSTESSIPSATSLVSTKNSVFPSSIDILHRDNNNNRNVDVNNILHRDICSSVLDSFVYMDCYQREV
ncbi:hypothetical protein AQUCO_00900244v1 [Aquilegia coerulea]|uniref:DUF7780 domain-containing protein n=1 Tax=Aquilegia coerulea TaxID=218851 RepID=A0A2G5ECS7_AQUCA|nr:hypothetical protein AQUCO_00900244v1 [Aquilegia coerulea]